MFGKWQMRHELIAMDWSLYWLALHEQEELDSELVIDQGMNNESIVH